METRKGRINDSTNNMTYQYNADIVKDVTKAIEIVGKNPKHD